MTFLEMQTEVFRRLEESSASPAFWTVAQVKAALNEGLDELGDATEFVETSGAVSLTANTTYYDLSSTAVLAGEPPLTVRRVFNDQTSRWLKPYDQRSLDSTNREWESNTGEPAYFWIKGLSWLGVYPKPAATSGTLTVHYSVLPSEMVANGATPDGPREFHLALVEYAVYDLLCQDREYKKAMKYWGRFSEKQEALRRFVNQRSVKDRVGGLG